MSNVCIFNFMQKQINILMLFNLFIFNSCYAILYFLLMTLIIYFLLNFLNVKLVTFSYCAVHNKQVIILFNLAMQYSFLPS